MIRSTLSSATAARPAGDQPRQEIVAPAAQVAAFVPAQPAPARSAPPSVSDDALLIAVRRSLASCRDSSQRRMLAAFEATH